MAENTPPPPKAFGQVTGSVMSIFRRRSPSSNRTRSVPTVKLSEPVPAVTENGDSWARAPSSAADRTTRPGCTPTAVVDQSPAGCRLTLHRAMSARPLASSVTRQNQPSISVPWEGSGFP